MNQPELIARHVLGPYKTKKAATTAVKEWLQENPSKSYYGHEVGRWKSGSWGASVYHYPNF